MSDESVRVSNSIPCYSFVITKRGLLGQAYVAPCSCLTDEAYGSCGQGGLTCPNLHLPINQKLIYLFRFSRWKNGVLTISATASLLHHV